jgi:hypothetical protein
MSTLRATFRGHSRFWARIRREVLKTRPKVREHMRTRFRSRELFFGLGRGRIRGAWDLKKASHTYVRYASTRGRGYSRG